MGQDTRNCIDVDECSQNRGGCGVTEDCVNVFGSFYCACPGGSPYLVDSSTCSACQHRDTDNLDAVYLWDLPPITSPYVVKVKADNPVYMALSSENTDTDSMVQITIGPVSSIGQGTDLTTAATPNVLPSARYRVFWISWSVDGTVSVRARRQSLPFLQMTTPGLTPSPVSYIGYHAGADGVADWEFCYVNGDWSEWGSWTPCDAACGFGMKARTRTCTNPLPVHVLGGTCIGPAAGSLMCYVPGVCSDSDSGLQGLFDPGEANISWADWQANWKSGKFLPSGYDSSEAPNEIGGMDVASTVYILNIGSLSEKHANISIRVQYVLSWIDSRLFGLAPSWVPVPPTLLWSPPLAFGQSVRAAAAEEEEDNSMWLDPRGLIVYKMTRRLRVSCVAELDRYPLDTQICKVALLGCTGCEFFHQVCDYLLEPCMTSLSDTCEAENCDNCRLVLGTCQYNMASCHNYINDTSAFTSLELRMRLRRVTWRYVLTAYLPSVVVVVTSYLQIWLSPEQSTISGRVALGTMAVLSMVAQTGKTVRMPWVERPRAIDIWMLGCLSFVTVALLETAFVNYISTYLQDKEQMKIRLEQRGKELNPPIRIPRPGLRDPTSPASGQHEPRRSSSISTGDTHVSIPRARLQVPPGVFWHQLPDKEWVIVLKKKAKTNSEKTGNKSERRRNTDENSVVSYIPDSCISSSDYEDFPDFDPRAFKPSAAERAEGLAKKVDSCARVIFPVIFMVFNIAYWIVYRY
ncbi:glycine receptor subunit alpha-2-like [Branchiostoma floridae x Branchiostoma belcheri]